MTLNLTSLLHLLLLYPSFLIIPLRNNLIVTKIQTVKSHIIDWLCRKGITRQKYHFIDKEAEYFFHDVSMLQVQIVSSKSLENASNKWYPWNLKKKFESETKTVGKSIDNFLILFKSFIQNTFAEEIVAAHQVLIWQPVTKN